MALPDDSDSGTTTARATPDPLHESTHPVQGAGPTLPAVRVRRVAQHIEENLERPLPLVELSAVVHMSPFHFARLFARTTGVPPHRFVLQRRMDAARVLLATGGTAIAVIARSVGFRTPSHFTTMFRNLFGMTPTAYRRINGQTAEDRPAHARCDGRGVA
jgi:AraC family transcriptional regulator